MRTYKSTCKSLQVLQEMERNMKIFYLFTSIVLTLFVISCKTVKDTSQKHLSVVDIDLSRISYSDSLHQELTKQIMKLEFDSLKLSMPAQDEKTVTATIYGGKVDSQKESAVIDTAYKEVADSLESHVDTEETVIKEVEQVAVGEPPNLFFLYLIIIIALLLFFYIKFIR